MTKAQTRRRFAVRNSAIHGRGVYALLPIRRGEPILEYKGERIRWREALRRHPRDPDHPNHTFFFSVSSNCLIDAGVHGNSARWINHSCRPNCEALMVEV